jgi:uncharacterized protein
VFSDGNAMTLIPPRAHTRRMVRRVLAALVMPAALALAACAHGPNEEASPVFPAPIWRASRPDSPAVFDLLGTIHLRPQRPPPFQRLLDAAVDAADVLVLEADVDLSALEAVGLVAWHGLSWRPLSTRLSAAQYAELQKKLGTLGQPPKAMDLFQPWLAAELLHIFEIQDAGYRSDHGIDAVLRRRAEAQDMPIRFLETANEQLGLFSSLAPEIQLEMLEEAITSTLTVARTSRLLAAYDRGDLSSLEALVSASAEERPAFMRSLLDDRNAHFADGIDEMTGEEARILVGVGAAHFVGEHGLPALLRDRGFEVRRFTVEDANLLLANPERRSPNLSRAPLSETTRTPSVESQTW